MERLRRQHISVVYLTIVFCGALIEAVPGARQFADTFDLLSFSWTIVPALLIGVYEAGLWRLINPRLDYSGRWDFEEKQFSISDTGAVEFAFDAWGSLKFDQGVRAIAIVEGVTHKGARGDASDAPPHSRWQSTSCDMDANTGAIAALLTHTTKAHRPGGDTQFGVENFTVTARGVFGRPIRMTSVVLHTIGAGKPYRVEVEYTRRGVRRPRTREKGAADAAPTPQGA